MVDIAHDAPAVGAPAGPPPGHAPHVVPAVVPRTIVPVKGLWIAGIVLAALIVAIATNKLWALEFFHVAFGGAWTAIDLFLGLVLGPILGTMSIPARVELTKRLMPKVAIIMPTIVTCTLAAGWQLGRLMGTIDSSYFHHGWVVASYIVVGAMALIALGVNEPANVAVLFELRKERPNGEVIGKLMKRFVYTAGILGACQVATLVIMTKIGSGA